MTVFMPQLLEIQPHSLFTGCVQPVSPGGIINVLTDAYIPKAARMYHHL